MSSQKIIAASKLVIANAVVLLLLLFILNIISYGVLQLKDFLNRNDATNAAVPVGVDPIDHFGYKKDDLQLQTRYSAYDGWKNQPYSGEYININADGFRLTVDNSPVSAENCWFFGGSTVWGYYNKDDTTIPSLFAQLDHQFLVSNYGEPGFNSRQGLTRMINLFSLGQRAELIISMDGVNDVNQFCYRSTPLTGHTMEKIINQRLAYSKLDNITTGFKKIGSLFYHLFLLNTHLVGEILRNKIFGKEVLISDFFCCHEETDRIEPIAEQLLRNWEMMHQLAQARGSRFIAILQPSIFFSAVRQDYVAHKLSPGIERQFELVYPVIQQKIREHNYDWIYDFTDVFDGHPDEFIYLDDCHLSPRGNQILVERIREIIAP